MVKKHKKSKKLKKHKEKKNKNINYTSNSDNSESSSENEWVEKKIDFPVSDSNSKREEWMTNIYPITTYSNNKINSKIQDNEKDKTLLYEPGQSSKELNPYWKNEGCGLPETSSNIKECSITSSNTIGDHGAEWYKKALKRAKQQAKDENKTLESVVSERWGSLNNLEELIKIAEKKTESSMSYAKNFSYKNNSSRIKTHFMKPSEENTKHTRVSTKHSEIPKKRWKKAYTDEKDTEKKKTKIINTNFVDQEQNSDADLLSNEEMNLLASKILKAEMMNNTTLVKELKEKLEKAQNVREKTEQENNVILLTATNVSGFTRPVNRKQTQEKKLKTYETHVPGKRNCYFEDDNKYSLKEMFEKEQMETSCSYNAEFMRLASTKLSNDSDTDDFFIEPDLSNKTRGNDFEAVINKQKNKDRALDDCLWCLMNNKLGKHLIISMGSKSFLCVPHFQSLTEGHCLIAPIYHATCITLLDEDVWQEVLDYCKKLVKIFRERDQDVIFFETAVNFKYYPHMLLHCVPIPYENSNFAPIYFKKAILECEKEWAMNKKLVEINKIDIKKSIPKGLPYFMVHFGLDNGFAHIIEDEKYFPKNFAQEIIGGMLDLDHRIWRKQQTDDFENQCKKVNNFKHLWKFSDSLHKT